MRQIKMNNNPNPDPPEDDGPPQGNSGAQDNNSEEGEDMDPELYEEDMIEVIDLDQQTDSDQIADDLDDIDLENTEGAVARPPPPRDDANVVFDKHTGSVFCVCLNSSASLVVTGGEDDKAYVWKADTGEVVFECTGHKDSVTCAAFSHDSTYVASGDMGGLLKVWKVDTKAEVWSFEVSDLEWLEWHHSSPVLFAGTAEGDMWMWKMPGGQCKTYQSPGCTCSAGRVMPDGKRLCAGYADGTIKLWDLQSCNTLQTFTGHTGHSGPITAISCHPDNTVVLTGSVDVTAKLLNTLSGKVLNTFNCSTSRSTSRKNEDEESDDSVEAVGFSSTQSLAATGTLSGVLGIWDLPTQVQRHHCKHEAGIVRLKWDPSSPLVYTCTLDGAVHMWDAKTGQRESQWFGHTEEILDFDIAKDGSVIVTGSGDGTARVFTIQGPAR